MSAAALSMKPARSWRFDKGLRLASNFSRFVICRDIPPGFHEVAIDTDELQKMRKDAA